MNKLNLNVNLLVSILDNYEYLNAVCVDLSKRNYSPGIIGLTLHTDKYEVYEVNDVGAVTVLLRTPDEDIACKEVLACVGMNYE